MQQLLKRLPIKGGEQAASKSTVTIIIIMIMIKVEVAVRILSIISVAADKSDNVVGK